MSIESEKIKRLQQQIKESAKTGKPLSLLYDKGHSNTTRSKTYKKGCVELKCGMLDQIIAIDVEKRRVLVEPRVTMEALVIATLKEGLIPPVIPEFKGITVGGAILGAAAESSSHRCGLFHDNCTQLHFLDGKGELIKASPKENADLFYGISGSYGAFGLLVSAELTLIKAPSTVHLTYYRFKDAQKALQKIEELTGRCDFLDGILFSREHAVIVSGNLVEAPYQNTTNTQWFAQKIKENRAESYLSLFDYLFRFDQGAFWMGSFLFSLPFLARYIGQGLMKVWPSQGWFTHQEIEKFKKLPFPGSAARKILHPLMHSQRLWGLLHKAEKWVQDRLIIQDFCIPLKRASSFLEEILKDPATFPIWLCPIKGTSSPQFLAPHHGYPFFINFGIYGSPSYSAPMQQIMQRLEDKTHQHSGRKVLYSRSYYDQETFWQIYPQHLYETLRKKTHAKGVWRELTEKVLSE